MTTLVVKISGGLGNQMFQYSFAKALENHYNSKVYFNIGFYDKQNPRKIELYNFGIKLAPVSKFNRFLFQLDSVRFYVRPFIKLARLIFRPIVINETNFSYTPEVFKKEGFFYYDGYWQTEKYFKSVEFEIRNVFKFKLENENIQKEVNFIESSVSIGVHIRRSDYVSNLHVKSLLGGLGINYYKRAMQKMLELTNKPTFVFFSDDIGWVKDNFPQQENYFYINGNISGFESMGLLSLCKHQIIANSSFSWWAAWLNSNKEKIVIAPNRWFANNAMQAQASDIIPESWLKIKVD